MFLGRETHAPDDKPVPVSLANGKLLGGFQLLHELGRGGMGTVYEAKHLKRGFHVALKVLPAVDGRSLQFFKSEFRRVAEINHPNLVTLHTLQADGGVWFFTMELIRGKDFHSYVAPHGQCDPGRLRASLTQLAAAVFKLHGENIIHCDLKPSNVLVDQNGRVVILDFGLSFEHGHTEHMSTQQLAGTPAYMAPEQAASQSLTGAADWYAVGVMLYEAMTGTLPISGSSPLEIIQKKQVENAPGCEPPDSTLSDLAELTDQLLQIDPQLRPNAMDVASRLTTNTADLKIETRAGETGSFLVGRETQLAALHSAFETVRTTSKPQVVFVSGRSGEGKTSLVEHFLSEINADHVALCGRCYDRESVPFKALDGLIDQLTNYLRKLPESEAALLMPDDVGFLAELFPVLNRVNAVCEKKRLSGAKLDHQQVRTRAFTALTLLLARISRDRTLIMFSDDLQWGDEDSAEALIQTLQSDESPRILLLGSFRSDEIQSSSFLCKWNSRRNNGIFTEQSVSVAPLTLEQCTELAVRTLGLDNENIRRIAFQFVSQTGGNPMLFLELISCYDPSEDSFEAIPLEDLIDRKLRGLPKSARLLLHYLAVAGHRSSLDELAIASNTKADAETVATMMRSDKLIRITGLTGDLNIDTYHDKIREATLKRLGEETSTIHRRIGETIERSVGSPEIGDLQIAIREEYRLDGAIEERLFDLSYHFDLSGESKKALAYSCLAAQQATRQFSQSTAAEQYLIATRHLDKNRNSGIQHLVNYGRTRALSLLGQYEEAMRSIQSLSPTKDRFTRAKMLGLEAEIAHKLGDAETGATNFRNGMRELGYFAPSNSFFITLGLLREIGTQIVHSFLPRFLYFRDCDPTKEEELAVEIANRSSMVTYYYRTIDMIYWHLKGLNLAEKRRYSRGLVYSYGLHPAPLSVVGLMDRGLRYSARARGLAEEHGDVLMLGHIATMRVMAHWTRGDHESAVRDGELAARDIEKAGDPYLLFITGWHVSISLFRLGRTTDSIAMVRDCFARSVRLGEQSGTGVLLFAICLVTKGKIPFPALRACVECGRGDRFTAILIKQAEGLWHLRFDRLEEAVSCLKSALNLSVKSRLIVPGLLPGYAWLCTAIRLLALTHSPQSDVRRASLKKCNRVLWLIRMLSRAFPHIRSHVYREVGLVHEASGSRSKAILWLERSVKAAESLNEPIEQAESTVKLNEIRKMLGQSVDSAVNDRAVKILAEYEADVKAVDLRELCQ